jgi:uncharacterized protein with von Willebrand factor type A (vWA) domain
MNRAERLNKLAGLFGEEQLTNEANDQIKIGAHEIKSWVDNLAKLTRLLNLNLDPNSEWAKEAMFLANMVWGDIATYKHQIKDSSVELRRLKLSEDDTFSARKEKLAKLFVASNRVMRDELEKIDSQIKAITDKHGKTPVRELLDHPDMAVLDDLSRRKNRINQDLMMWKQTAPQITDANMDSYIGKWKKLNDQIRDLNEDMGIEDGEEEYIMAPEVRVLVHQKKDIEEALDDFDDNWKQDYFGRGEDEDMDELESVDTMRNYR